MDVQCHNMETATIALIVLIIGVLLIIAEALNPGAFMVIPGVVMVIIGSIGFAMPDFMTSIAMPVTAVVTTLIVTLVTVKLYRYIAKPSPPETSVSDALLGRDAVVTATTRSTDLKGKVKIGYEVWSAVSDEPIEAGENVTVEAVEGVHVKVKRK